MEFEVQCCTQSVGGDSWTIRMKLGKNDFIFFSIDHTLAWAWVRLHSRVLGVWEPQVVGAGCLGEACLGEACF
jgi:hypothetical protein